MALNLHSEPAMNVQYRLLTVRGVALPLFICAGAFAALPFLGGLPLPSLSRRPVAPPAAPSVERFTQEVYVPNVARGCRWQYTNQADVQIADCGDDSETIRIVFERGKVTEYRLIARQDPNKVPSSGANGASGVAGALSVQQPSQPGRVVPNQPPLRVTPSAGS